MKSVTKILRRMLDERGIKWTSHGEEYHTWYDANGGARVMAYETDAGYIRIEMGGLTPEQAIAATVGNRDTMELWPEWEQVLFANVSDEVAQDNLNECVHELLEKAATIVRSCASCPEMDNPDSYIMHLHRALEVADRGVGMCHSTSKWTNVFECSMCGFKYDFITDPYQGPRYCPNCGKKVMSE